MPISNIARPVVARPTNPLPARPVLAPRQTLAVDTFTPASASQIANTNQPSAPVAAATKKKGFFSGLWDRLKGVFSGLLGKAEQKVTQQAPGIFDRLKTLASGMMDKLFSKAMGWVGGLFANVQNKLTP